jgi:hypothetical protein
MENRDILFRAVKQLREKSAIRNEDKERSMEIKKLVDECKSISYAELRGKFGMGKTQLWSAIEILLKEYPGEYAVKKSSRDKRERLLIKLPAIK